MRIAFAKALRDIDGATAVEKKADGPDGVRVTLKGKADAMEQVFAAVSSKLGKVKDATGSLKTQLELASSLATKVPKVFKAVGVKKPPSKASDAPIAGTPGARLHAPGVHPKRRKLFAGISKGALR